MRTRRRRLMILGLVIFTAFSAVALAMGQTPDVVGKAVSSFNATVEGTTLLSHSTVLSGDTISVGEGGSVLLSFSSAGLAALSATTSVRFSSGNGNTVAQLISGTLGVEREKKGAFVVSTSAYRVEPQGEGRAEFLVALLPDKRTIVEAQQGKLTITETASGESYTLGEGLRAEIPASATGLPGQGRELSKVIGKVTASTGATKNGSPLSSGDTVSEGDLVSTGAGGHTVIQLSSRSQVTFNENTSAHLTRVVERGWLGLQKGTVVMESTGENYAVVATEKFHIAPNSAAPSKIYVGVMTDKSTYIESAAGDVRIEDIQTGQIYVLPAGQSTLVPPNASGIPGLQPSPATAPAQGAPPSQPQPPSGAKTPFPHTTALIVGIAGGAAAAGAVAGVLSSGGHAAPPVSPASP